VRGGSDLRTPRSCREQVQPGLHVGPPWQLWPLSEGRWTHGAAGTPSVQTRVPASMCQPALHENHTQISTSHLKIKIAAGDCCHSVFFQAPTASLECNFLFQMFLRATCQTVKTEAQTSLPNPQARQSLHSPPPPVAPSLICFPALRNPQRFTVPTNAAR